MSVATGISLEEYLHTSYEPDCDYVDGVLEERNVGKRKHGRSQQRLIVKLTPLMEPLGFEALPEPRIQVSPTRVRIPDICIVPLCGPEEVLTSPPVLVIEIMSPDDRVSRMMKVISDYLTFGVPMIWIIDPYNREIFLVTQKRGAQPVDELRWNDVIIKLTDIVPN